MNNSKIKVLHAIRQGKFGGGETHVLDLVQQLDKTEFDSIVLAFTDGPLITELKKNGVKTHVIITENPFDIKLWKNVKDLMKREKIDILHAHGTRAQSNTFWAARKLGIPIIYTVHGWSFHPDQNFLINKLRKVLEGFLVSKANVTVCVSENNMIEGKANFNMKDAVVIKNGVNFLKFDSTRVSNSTRSSFKIRPDVFLVGYIARITAQKDPFTFIKAIAKIPAEMNFHFLVVGDGDLKSEMMSLSKELKVDQKLTFSGFRQDIAEILSVLDIYCLPSLWEGLPIGLLEAMSMRKATISTSVDGNKEVIQHNSNGLLMEPGDSTVLAESIIRLANDDKLRTKIAERAEISVKKEYSIEKMTKAIEALYKTTLNK